MSELNKQMNLLLTKIFQNVIWRFAKTSTAYTHKRKNTVPLLSEPPDSDWRSRAEEVVKQAEANLWSEQGKPALHYLKVKRGLTENTILKARLGYIPGGYRDWKTINGLDWPCPVVLRSRGMQMELYGGSKFVVRLDSNGISRSVVAISRVASILQTLSNQVYHSWLLNVSLMRWLSDRLPMIWLA